VAEGKYEDPIPAMQRQINELQRENQNMQKALAEVANANVLPTVLQHGFESVIAELRPLRDLTPQRASVDELVAKAAAAMLNAMEGVILAGDSLEIRPVNVPFIGQVRPVPSTPDPYRPDPYRPDPYRPDQYKPDPHKTDPYTADPYKTDPDAAPDQTIKQQPPKKEGYRP